MHTSSMASQTSFMKDVTSPDFSANDKGDEEQLSCTTEDGSSTEGEEGFSLEEGSSTSESEAFEPQQLLFQLATDEEKREAIRQYGERFGRDDSGKQRKSLPMNREQTEDALDSPKRDHILAQLDRDLAPRPKVAEPAGEQVLPVCGDLAELADSVDESLRPTFGYAGSLSENPPFAKFDVRDHICLKVGGYRHGQVVCHRGGGHMIVVGVKPVDGTHRLWFHPLDLGRPGAGAFRGTSREALNVRLSPVPDHEAERILEHDAPHFHEMKAEDFMDLCVDSDGEEVHLCCHCRLPVGSVAYTYGKTCEPVHGECRAELMKNEMKQKDDAQKTKNKDLKQKHREEYGIGWDIANIPSNMLPAVELGCLQLPQGMCCLVFDEADHSVTVAPTLEPAQAVNLEYLSLALQVRLRDGRAPLFSLDPLDPGHPWEKNSMQEKRFEPEWLAGTSVGEVMFQADYHLKELSMGACEQPVVGMKSCFDFTEIDGLHKEWNAREWFVVRKAEVLMTEDNILTPRVRMGVEAREMIVKGDELVDLKVTRPDHPMVKFAESFTQGFDLIAERKSVIFQLRELAKASVIAKMLIESDVNLYGPWLDIARPASDLCCMEVPQLWNEREYAKIHVHQGEIMKDGAFREGYHSHGIYGGVNFGLEKIAVTSPSLLSRGPKTSRQASASLSAVGKTSLRATAASSPVTLVAAGASLPAAVVKPPTAISTAPVLTGVLPAFPQSLAVKLATSAPSASIASGFAASARPAVTLSSMSAPRGVVGPIPTALIPGRPALGLSAMAMPANLSPGLGFAATRLLSVTPAKPMMPIQTRPSLGITAVLGADPRGVDLNLDQFNLSQPVKVQGESWSASQDVKCASLGSTFFQSIDGSGNEFTEDDKKLLRAIYSPSLCDRRQEGDQFIPPDTSYDYVNRLRNLVAAEENCQRQRKLRFLSSSFSAADPGPLFPASWKPSVEIQAESVDIAQNHLRARPEYKACSQKFDHVLKSVMPTFDRCTEEAVRFRIYHIGSLEVRTTQEPQGKETIGAVFSMDGHDQKIHNSAKTIEEHEKIEKVIEYVEKAEDGRRSYVEFVTDQGNKILTEKLSTGITTWLENPVDLEDRNSLAKVVRAGDCRSFAESVSFIKALIKRESVEADSSCSKRKQYAQALYARVMGEPQKDTGFWKEKDGAAWQLSERTYGLYASRHHPSMAEKSEEQPFGEGPQRERRPQVGETVKVKATGRIGDIVVDDRGDTPYKVRFEDGQIPKTKWLRQNQVYLCPKPEK